MTTIAYKDGIIAFDGRITSGNQIVSDNYNKCLLAGSARIIGSGDISELEAYAKSYPNYPASKKDMSGFVVDGDKCWCFYALDDTICFTDLDRSEPRAFGSGSDHALTAMDMGASAEEAVAMASKRDKSTGGKISIVDIR
jgi:ATP-dependent protease HslVU (ClpYQ) peptidase subunit